MLPPRACPVFEPGDTGVLMGAALKTDGLCGNRPVGLNDIWYDPNGPFEAVRCTEEDWLDYDYDPDLLDFPTDPDCKHP